MLLSKLRQRLAREESGFTLIELLVVLIIIAVLLAIAVPSYLGFRDRAQDRAAEANVRSAIPAVEAFYSDNGDYSMDLADLKAIDQGLKVTYVEARTVNDNPGYCLQATDTGTDDPANKTKHVVGPGGDITDGACPAAA